jgi:hypothetical protein
MGMNTITITSMPSAVTSTMAPARPAPMCRA